MCNLKSLSAHILALALYCRDSGQVPFSIRRFMALIARSAWSILSSAAGSMLQRFLLFSITGWLTLFLKGLFPRLAKFLLGCCDGGM